MIVLILLLVALGLVLLEKKWAQYATDALQFRQSCDHPLAEPEQIITCLATVENHSKLPVPFVRLSMDFPKEAKTVADRHWWNAHCREKVLSWYAEFRMTLGARQRLTRTVEISVQQRGVYNVGTYQLSVGDLLGFRERKRVGTGQKIVVMPSRSQQQKAVDAVGGFLGDVSVRRFILEDPILTVGFRDYTGREPMRAISWTRTAQMGSLCVRQYDHTAEHHVVVLLDTENAKEELFEECLRLTRTVCEYLEQKKIAYGFSTNGNLPGPVGNVQTMEEGLGERHLNTILYGLGCADETCFFSFEYLTAQVLKKRKGNESYIVITSGQNPHSQACIRQLSNAVGNPVCVLTACEEGK